MRAMKQQWMTIAAVAASLLAGALAAHAQNENQGKGQAVVTVLPKNDKQPTSDVQAQQVKIEVAGKQTAVTNWQALRGSQSTVELVMLIDDGARLSLGREMGEIKNFVQSLPPNVKFAFAYMEMAAPRCRAR